MNVKARNNILRAVIFISFLPTLLFLNYEVLNANLGYLAFIARLAGLLATMIIFWEYALGIRGIVGKFTPDMPLVNKIHRDFGKFGIPMLALHPILLIIYYFQRYQVDLLNFKFDNLPNTYRNLGVIGLAILLVTLISSVYLRKKFKFRTWHFLHTLTYLILPLVILHNIGLGRSDVPVPARGYWITLGVIYAVLVIYQLLFSYGIFKKKYRVEIVDREAKNVINIRMKPMGNKMILHPGQYIYIQRKRSLESHPFSISHFPEPVTDLVCIAPKAIGSFSAAVQDMSAGEVVYLDGPYGVFTSEVDTTTKPVIFIAGGIGMVPFMPSIDLLTFGMGKETTLFYGNNTQDEIAFFDELELAKQKTDKLKVVHVLRDEEKPGFGKGFVTVDLMSKHLPLHVSKYEYFVCGPPPMIHAIEKDLIKAGVPKDSIHFELFG